MANLEFIPENFTDLMLDVETLGRDGKFVVTEVSFVPFSLGLPFEVTPEVEALTLKCSISVKDSLKKGFKINSETVEWWIGTDKEKFKQQLDSEISINFFCSVCEDYIKKFTNLKRVWATAALDYQAISNLFDSCGRDNPIRYNKRMCARTLNMLADNFLGTEKAEKRVNDHDSVQDCINQIFELCENFDLMQSKIV